MKIVLATAPDEWATKEHLPPLSLGYIASVLEEAGHEVAIIDSPAYSYSVSEASERIVAEKPDVVGGTATTHTRFLAIEMCDRIKREAGALVLVGGPHFATTARDALENVKSIDIVVRGEGEYAVREIVDAYSKEEDWGEVPGIVYRHKDGQIIETPQRLLVPDLDSIPVPAWHLFDLKKYDATLEGEYKTPSIGVISSRGCPFHCTFCVNRAFWNCNLRVRDPGKFVDEVEFLHKRYGYTGFDIWDDTLTVSKERVKKICEEFNRRKLDIVWYARARVNTVDKDLLKIMRQSGCQAISYGVESGSEPILHNIAKKITIPQAKDAIKTSAELGFYIKAFFMLSLPGETADDIRLTLRLIDELSTYGPNVNCMEGFTLIYPGTEIEQLGREQGILPPDFSWNKPHVFERSKLVEANPGIPLYENKDLPVEQILQIVSEERYRPSRMLSRGWRRLTGIRDVGSLKALYNDARDTLRRKRGQ